MSGIPREVAEHALEIRAGSKLVKQRLRRFNEEKHKVIGEEIHKLLKAGVTEPTNYMRLSKKIIHRANDLQT
jgi:hypothetical protein